MVYQITVDHAFLSNFGLCFIMIFIVVLGKDRSKSLIDFKQSTLYYPV
jgi:hypothetical protein